MNKLKHTGLLCAGMLICSGMTGNIKADALTLSSFFDPVTAVLADLQDSVTITPYGGYEIASCEIISGENCIMIDENFTVRPVENGTAEIYVYSADGKQGYTEITVDFSQSYSKVSVLGSDFRIYNNHAELVKYTAPRTFAYEIPATVAGLPVTEISDYAFQGTIWTPEIIIPDTVTRIGTGAFMGCQDLEKITLPASLKEIGDKAFYGDKLLTEIIIPEGTEIIGGAAFAQCTALENISFPSTLKEIRNSGTRAFWRTAWETNQRNQTEPVIYAGTFAYDYTGNWDGFTNTRDQLTELTFREDTTGIAERAFRNYENLQHVTFPDGLKYINSKAFYACKSLEDIQLPEQLEALGADAFYTGYYGVLEKISISENNLYFASVDGIIYDKNLTKIIAVPTNLKNAEIPDTVTVIPEHAFYSCRNMTALKLPAQLVSIADYAFYDCKSLKNLQFPDGLTSIGEMSFFSCSSLTRAELPDTVTEIGKYAFYGCTELKLVKLSAGMTELPAESELVMIIPELVVDTGDDYGLGVPDCENTECVLVYQSIFENCFNLRTLIFPKELVKVYDGAFYPCNIRDTYYTGTMEEWEAVEKGADNNYGTVHFNVNPASALSGDTSLDGEFTVSDIVMLKKYLLGQSGLTEQGFANADLNHDNIINIYDLILMKKFLLAR